MSSVWGVCWGVLEGAHVTEPRSCFFAFEVVLSQTPVVAPQPLSGGFVVDEGR